MSNLYHTFATLFRCCLSAQYHKCLSLTTFDSMVHSHALITSVSRPVPSPSTHPPCEDAECQAPPHHRTTAPHSVTLFTDHKHTCNPGAVGHIYWPGPTVKVQRSIKLLINLGLSIYLLPPSLPPPTPSPHQPAGELLLSAGYATRERM